jgi:hypothetical protein
VPWQDPFQSPQRPRRSPRLVLGLALAALGLTACQGRDRWPVIDTQRWPGPMAATRDPLLPGVNQLHPPGIEEVLVVRHADPVQIQPAGQPAAFPLFFYDKQRRVNAGSWVFSAPGGRAELIWPSGANLLLFGRCTGVVGSPARGEPVFTFREVEVAQLNPRPGERYELLVGAVLDADEGPFRLERRENGVLRVRSQAKVPASILYRDETLRLDPGEVLDLPLLDVLGRPAVPLTGVTRVPGPGFEVAYAGEAEVWVREGVVTLVGGGEHEARALGVRVRLAPGERVHFTGLGPLPPEARQPMPEARQPMPATDPGAASVPGGDPGAAPPRPGEDRR